MNQINKFIGTFILLILLKWCDNTEMITYEKYSDYPCGLAKSSIILTDEEDYLYNYKYEKGIIEIDLRFLNTCGSAYKDSVNISDNSIYIFLDDTSTIHARCICTHQSLLEFEVSGYNNLNLMLYINPYAYDEYFLALDTLIQL